jgi:hypothetical protein
MKVASGCDESIPYKHGLWDHGYLPDLKCSYIRARDVRKGSGMALAANLNRHVVELAAGLVVVLPLSTVEHSSL